MNYEEAMQYIHAVQWAGHKPGLSRTRTLLAALGSPHKRLKFVHVAGTNGKGSTAAMLASCLRAAGYCVGLYTSPFINRFNERIQVDGEQIGDEELVRLVEKIRPAADAMADVPTEFEVITALGMLYFAEKQCDMYTDTATSLLDSRDAIMGVSETEEGVNMLNYSKWFNASSRMLTTLDEALDTIIEKMGLVGR